MTQPIPTASGDAEPIPAASGDRFRLLVDSVLDYAIFMLDPRGRILSWNAGAERLKGYRADEIIGQSFERFYPAEALAAGWPQQELRIATAEGRFEEEGWRLRKDGSAFWASVVITALRGPEGRLEGFAKVTRDLSERRRHEETLRRSEEQFRLLLESVKDYAIYLLDPEGHVLTWNTGAQAIKGYAAPEVIGRHFSMFFLPEDAAQGVPEAELKEAARTGRVQGEGRRVRKDGSVFRAHIVLTPVHDEQGGLRGFAKVTRDVSDLSRLTELEQSSRRVNAFIAMLGHELRNPMAPIRNAVSVLQLQPDLPAPVKRTADLIARQLGHMTRMVDDLLDVSRISTGKIVLRRDAIDFHRVVESSVEAAWPAIESRQHRLEVDAHPAPLPVRGDTTRLVQALHNLLENAARYTPPGGDIALRVGPRDGAIVVTVADSGIGIGAEAQLRIFELFTQEHRTASGSEHGLGIGLALARSLIEQHGGRLSVESAGVGRGSTFTVWLPLEPADADAAATADAGAEAGAAGADLSGEPAAAAPLRVLVVDDNHDAADTMLELLDMMGQTVRAAYGAEHAIEVAAAFDPQLVLLDLHMPDGDGFSVLRRLRAAHPRPLYAVAVTGYGQPQDRARTHAAGFQSHLTKPVLPEQLGPMLAVAARFLSEAGAPA